MGEGEQDRNSSFREARGTRTPPTTPPTPPVASPPSAPPPAPRPRPTAPPDPRKVNAAVEKAIHFDHRPLSQKVKERVAETADRFSKGFTQGMFDEVRSFANLYDPSLPMREREAYVLARLARHSSGQMEAFLTHGRPRWDAAERMVMLDPTSPGLMEIVGDLGREKLKEFEGYAYARRVDSQGLLTDGREKNLTQDDVDALLALEVENPEFPRLFDQIQDWKTAFLDLAEAAGLVNQDQRAVWEHADHVPFYRLSEDEATSGPKTGGQFEGQSAQIRKLTGGGDMFVVQEIDTGKVVARYPTEAEAQAEAGRRGAAFTVEKAGQPIPGIIENLVANASHLMQASMFNLAAREAAAEGLTAGLVERVPASELQVFKKENVLMSSVNETLREKGVPTWLFRRTAIVNALRKKGVLLPTYAPRQTGRVTNAADPFGINMPMKDLLALARANGIDPNEVTFQQTERMWTMQRMDRLPPNVVQVMVDGKPEFYRVLDPLLYQSFAALRQTQLTGIFKPLNWYRGVFSRLIVSDPGYMLRNLIRDTVSQIVQTDMRSGNPIEEGALALKNSVAAMRHSMAEGRIKGGKTDPRVLAIMAGGADTGWYQNAPDDAVRQLQRGMAAKRWGLLQYSNPRVLWSTYEKIGRAGELMNRLSTYDATLARTGSQRAAIFEAADALDFQLKGAWPWVQQMTAIVPFLNARLQGLYRLGRGAVQNPKAFAIKGGILATFAIALALINGTDDDEDGYNSLPEWMKDANFVIPIYRMLPAEILEKAGLPRFLLIPKPFEVGVLFGTVWERTLQSQAVLGSDRGKDSWNSFVAAMLSTFAFNPVGHPWLLTSGELWANKSVFLQRDIVPRGLERLKPEWEFNAQTSDTARLVGGMIGTSPPRIEYAVRGYFGTAGAYVLMISDALVRLAEGKSLPDVRRDELPIVRSFIVDAPLRNTKWLERFYDLREEVNETYNTIRHVGRTVGPEAAQALQSRDERVAGLQRTVEATSRTLSGLRLLEQRVRDFDRLEPTMKRAVLETLSGSGINGMPRFAAGATEFSAADRRAALNAILVLRNQTARRTEELERMARSGSGR